MASESKYVMRCHYEVLGLEDRKSDEDEIKKAYKKMALRYHPDKNRDNIEEATVKFKEVQNAYGVLSDPDERSWYDSHRDKILRGGDARGGGGAGDDSDDDYDGPDFLNLWKFFGRQAYTNVDDKSENGFFGVFNKVFSTIFEEDSEWLPRGANKYPAFGDADKPWADVQQFYQFWQSYFTKKSYAWKDEYKVNELPDRNMRRAAEKINAGHREAAKREYSRLVQSLVDQCRRNDPRVEAEQKRLEKHMKMKEEEREKRQEEAVRRRAEERKRWMEEAKEQEKESMVSIHEEVEVLEQLYAMRTSAKSKQPPKQPNTPLYTQDEHGNDIKIVHNDDDEEEENNKKKIFKCEHCKKTLASEKLYTEHCNSNKHKTQLKKLGIDPKTGKKFGEEADDADEDEEKQENNKDDNNDEDDGEKNKEEAESIASSSPTGSKTNITNNNNNKAGGKKAGGKKGGNNNTKQPTVAAKNDSDNDDDGEDEAASSAPSSTQSPKLTKKQKKQQQQQQALQAKAKQSQQMKNLPPPQQASSDESSDDDSSSDDGAPKVPAFQTGSSKKKKRR